MAVADTPDLLEQLKECNAQLDVVEKGLNEFLETKKMAFPRWEPLLAGLLVCWVVGVGDKIRIKIVPVPARGPWLTC